MYKPRDIEVVLRVRLTSREVYSRHNYPSYLDKNKKKHKTPSTSDYYVTVFFFDDFDGLAPFCSPAALLLLLLPRGLPPALPPPESADLRDAVGASSTSKCTAGDSEQLSLSQP